MSSVYIKASWFIIQEICIAFIIFIMLCCYKKCPHFFVLTYIYRNFKCTVHKHAKTSILNFLGENIKKFRSIIAIKES